MAEAKHVHNPYHISRMTELKAMFWVHSATVLSSSLAVVFIPALLYRMGFSLTIILWVYIGKTVLSIGLQYVALRLSHRFGANRTMALSEFSDAIYFSILFWLTGHSELLWLLVVVWGVDRAFYWSAFHTNFSGSRDRDKEGSEVGLINALVLAAGSIAPAISGVIIDSSGPKGVLWVAILISIMSGVTLLALPSPVNKEPFERKQLDYRLIRRDLLASGAMGIMAIADTMVWPLFVFLIVGSFAKLGAILMVITVFNIVASLYVGRNEKTRGSELMLRGLSLSGMANLLRLFASTGLQAAGINALSGVGKSLYQTPFFASYYRHADTQPRLEYVTAMESANSIGVTLFLLVPLVLSMFISAKTVLLITMLLVIPISWGPRLIRRHQSS